MTGSVMSMTVRSRSVRVAVACLVQAVLVAVAVAPSLSARLTGDEYRLAVSPVDPIDPFRGAYVALQYPGLEAARDRPNVATGTVFVPLQPVAGTDLWEGGQVRREAPESGPYLRCNADDWRLRCGIESVFTPQDEALRLERELARGAVARVRVDGRGNAAMVAVEPTG